MDGQRGKKATYTEADNGIPPIDPRDEKLRQQQRELEDLRRRMAIMEAQSQQKPAPPAAKVVTSVKRVPVYFVTNERKDEAFGGEPTYTLAPGATKIACTVETKFSSDIDSHFTATVKRGIADTATGGHPLIPQNSTITGQASGESLVFGNERLPTMGLTVTLPDGRVIDLGEVPVMDREGVTGLVSHVNHHWKRNIGAALLMGVLRGGQQAIQQGLANSGAGALVSEPGQVGQQLIGKAIDTRPTITVDAGEGCTVLLLKELRLPRYQHRAG